MGSSSRRNVEVCALWLSAFWVFSTHLVDVFQCERMSRNLHTQQGWFVEDLIWPASSGGTVSSKCHTLWNIQDLQHKQEECWSKYSQWVKGVSAIILSLCEFRRWDQKSCIHGHKPCFFLTLQARIFNPKWSLSSNTETKYCQNARRNEISSKVTRSIRFASTYAWATLATTGVSQFFALPGRGECACVWQFDDRLD